MCYVGNRAGRETGGFLFDGGMGHLVSDNGELDTPPAGAGLLWTSAQ